MRAPFLHVARRAPRPWAVVAALLASILAAAPAAPAVLAAANTPAANVTPANVTPANVTPANVTPANVTPANTLTLESQSPAFVASASGVNLAVNVTSALPAARLALDLTLDSQVISRYVFRETLSGGLNTVGPLPGGNANIPLSWKALHWSSGHSVTLQLPISAPDLTGKPGTGTDGAALSLECEPPYCGGVYPLQVALLDTQLGVTLSSFTTYVIVAPPSEEAGTQKLEFAWTIPVGTTPAISPSGTAAADSNDLRELGTLSSILNEAPGAAVSLNLFPQFLEALGERKDSADEAGLSVLQSLTAAGGQAAVVPSTFTPVNLDAVMSSGGPSAVAQLIDRARSVMTVEKIPSEPDALILSGPISPLVLHQLEESGVARLLVPNAGMQALTDGFQGFTPTTPFLIPHSGIEGMASDPGLESDLASTASPALKAQQMLADLSILYFDTPHDSQALALDTPIGLNLSPAFLGDVLRALSSSPCVQAVTLGHVFDTVTPGSRFSPGRRGLRSVATPADQQLPTDAIQAAIANLAALQSMLPSVRQPATEPPLSDLILMSETSGLALSARSAYLSTINSRAGAVGGYLSLPFGRVITVTSLRATIPISIFSTSKVPIVVQLTVTGLDLVFPKGQAWTITLTPRTNVVKISLAAHTAGTYQMQLTLQSRTGYVIQSGTMTIQSTAISGVAVALSIAAGLVLIVWWIRSILGKRRRRHKERGAELAAAAIPAGVGASSAGSKGEQTTGASGAEASADQSAGG